MDITVSGCEQYSALESALTVLLPPTHRGRGKRGHYGEGGMGDCAAFVPLSMGVS